MNITQTSHVGIVVAKDGTEFVSTSRFPFTPKHAEAHQRMIDEVILPIHQKMLPVLAREMRDLG